MAKPPCFGEYEYPMNKSHRCWNCHYREKCRMAFWGMKELPPKDILYDKNKKKKT